MPPRKDCPNSEWARWIQEAADQAIENNARVSETYRKAAKAIKNYPHKLNHPKDALALPGVGPKVVKILSGRLEAWCHENQAMYPRQVRLAHNPGCVDRARSQIDQPDANVPSKSGSGIRAKKAYQPKVRGPAWGILAALYTICEPGDLKKFSSRETIVERASMYSDCSYIHAKEDTTKRYGPPWVSGITALVKHGFVISHDTLRPAKYALTRSGYEIASVIAAQEGLPLLGVEVGSTSPYREEGSQSTYFREGSSVSPKASVVSGSTPVTPHHAEITSDTGSLAAPPLAEGRLIEDHQQLPKSVFVDAVSRPPVPFRFYYINPVKPIDGCAS